jgi:four helix bundle protein
MFDFEKLEVYQLIKNLNIEVLNLLNKSPDVDLYLKDQLKRATLSVAFNLSEGTGRVTAADKKRFYVIARSSVYECVAILDMLKETNKTFENRYSEFYVEYEKISKMLLALYRSHSRK